MSTVLPAALPAAAPTPVPGAAALFRDGLWRQNPALVQLLGLCPLMAVSTTMINGICLGLATTLVMGATGAAVSLLRRRIPPHLRIPAFILVIAILVTLIDLGLNAWLHTLYRVLGLFVPLIVTNCIVLARAEVFASRAGAAAAALDGLSMGLGLSLALAVLGGLRELLGQGTVLAGLDGVLSWPAGSTAWKVYDGGFPLALLPPGAFLTLGVLIALRNRVAARSPATAPRP